MAMDTQETNESLKREITQTSLKITEIVESLPKPGIGGKTKEKLSKKEASFTAGYLASQFHYLEHLLYRFNILNSISFDVLSQGIAHPHPLKMVSAVNNRLAEATPIKALGFVTGVWPDLKKELEQ